MTSQWQADPCRASGTRMSSVRPLTWSHPGTHTFEVCYPCSLRVGSVSGVDPRTDEGLRQTLRAMGRSGSWDQPACRRLFADIRWSAFRNAAQVATSTVPQWGAGWSTMCCWPPGWCCAGTATRCSPPSARGRT